ncbi:MAG TPA: SAM-dependent methyltransferase [Terracidiphilus sp.]|jgi:methyltransferase (TIGR00027 family)|nr:SAM-dependent methyltransferase [Terracidiphilus sp.]
MFYFMPPDDSSKTAEYMALFRALETRRSSRTRLFADPLSTRFLRPPLRRIVSVASLPGGRELIEKILDHRIPGARSSAIARTRLIDDLLAEGMEDEAWPLVILGAGFDCRAYRLQVLKRRDVFELDQAQILEKKRARLNAQPGTHSNVRQIPIDFNRESLCGVLERAGLNASLKTAFLWEGVTNYLTAEAVDSVLTYVSRFPAGSRLVFTYVHSGMLDGTVKFHGAERLLADVAKLGEPWTFGIHPRDMDGYLERCGLRLVVDLGASEYRQRYFGDAAGEMRGYEFYHVAMAEVPRPAENRTRIAPAGSHA